MAKDNKSKKAPESEAGKSATSIVEDRPSAANLLDLGTAVTGQAAPSRITSRPQVIKIFISLHDTTITMDKNIENLHNYEKRLIDKNNTIDLVRGGQIQPDRASHMVMAIKVQIKHVSKILFKSICTIRIVNFKKSPKKVIIKCHNDINRCLSFKLKIRLRKYIDKNLNIRYNIILIQDDDDGIEQVRNEARKLEEDDELLERDDSDTDSYHDTSNGLEDTIFIPDAEHTLPGGSSQPPPVINMAQIVRNTARAGRRSSMTIPDEIDSRDGEGNKDKDKCKDKDAPAKGGKNDNKNKKGKMPKKRSNEENVDNNKTIPKKKFRKSYVEVAKEGAKMCEVRSRTGLSLNQRDYDHLILKLMYALKKVQRAVETRNRALWIIHGSGLSRSAVWLGVGSDDCVSFLRVSIPTITDEEGDPIYLFFGPGERPWRNIRWRVPYMWTRVPLEELQEMITMCNPELWELIERSDGSKTEPIWKLRKRVHDDRDVVPEDGSGFVSFMLEVEDDMMDILVQQCLGELRIGATVGRLTGSGIVAAVCEFLGMSNDDDQNEEENQDEDDGGNEKKDDKKKDDEKNDDEKMDDNDENFV